MKLPLYNLIEDKSMLLTHFYFVQEKKWKPGLYLQQEENILVLNLQPFCQQIDKKGPFGKMNCKICFFVGIAMKIAVAISWCTTPVSLH